MHSTDLASALAELKGDDLETQVIAVEQLTGMVNLIAVEMVEALRVSPAPFLIAERIHKIGTVIVEPLERLVKESGDWEIKTLASLSMHYAGGQSEIGYQWLLEALRTGDDYCCVIAKILAQKEFPGIREIILEKLRGYIDGEDYSRETVECVSCLLDVSKVHEYALTSDLTGALGNSIIGCLNSYQLETITGEAKDAGQYSFVIGCVQVLGQLGIDIPQDITERLHNNSLREAALKLYNELRA